MLHPQGIYNLLIVSVKYHEKKKSGNNMYIITLVDEKQKYSPIKDYLMLNKNYKRLLGRGLLSDFSVISRKKAKSLLEICDTTNIEEIEGCLVKVNIAYKFFATQFFPCIAEYLDHTEGLHFKKYSLKEDKLSKCRTYSLSEKREIYSNAYLSWSENDDEQLKFLYRQGKGIDELCVIFKRNRGAINSRIKKLGLKNQET